MKKAIMAKWVCAAGLWAGAALAPVRAVDLFMTNTAVSNSLNTAANYDPNQVPTAADRLIFTNVQTGPAWFTNVMTSPLTVNSMIFQSTGASNSVTRAVFSTLFVTNVLEVGVADGSLHSVEFRTPLVVTNSSGTASVVVGGTNTGRGVFRMSFGGNTLITDWLFVTNTGGSGSPRAFGSTDSVTIKHGSVLYESGGEFEVSGSGLRLFGGTHDWTVTNGNASFGADVRIVDSTFNLTNFQYNTRVNNSNSRVGLTNGVWNQVSAGTRLGTASGSPPMITNSAAILDAASRWVTSNLTVGDGGSGVTANNTTNAGNFVLLLNTSSVDVARDTVVGGVYGGNRANILSESNFVRINNSAWTNRGQMIIGDLAGARVLGSGAGTFTNVVSRGNYVTVENGGSLYVQSNVLIGFVATNAPASRGNVSENNRLNAVSGLVAVSNAAQNAAINVLNGVLNVAGGTVVVDRLIGTNAAGANNSGSNLEFSQGRISSRSTVWSNGVAAVVGDAVGSLSNAVLHLNGGTHSFAHGLNVTNDGALTGNGSVVGNTVISGLLAPGNSPGAIVFSNDLTLLDSAVTAFEIAGTNLFDFVQVDGALAYAGTFTVNFDTTYADGTSWDLFDFGSQSGGWTNLTLTGGYAGSLTSVGDLWSGTFGLQIVEFNELNGVLSISAIPEPSTMVMLGLGAGLLALARRRSDRR